MRLERVSRLSVIALLEASPRQKAQSSEGTESSSSTISSTSHGSRPSTPPTDLSSSLSSPTFAPPVETEDIIRRRQQSDQASTEIGKRLLKGWTMLAEECPNTRCYGVPLVRPPKTGIDKDPRKVCGYPPSLFITCDTLLTRNVSYVGPYTLPRTRKDGSVLSPYRQGSRHLNSGQLGAHSNQELPETELFLVIAHSQFSFPPSILLFRPPR